jgi:hypothetical protein
MPDLGIVLATAPGKIKHAAAVDLALSAISEWQQKQDEPNQVKAGQRRSAFTRMMVCESLCMPTSNTNRFYIAASAARENSHQFGSSHLLGC